MKPQEITFKTLQDDITISFRLAARHIFSFILGVLGMGLIAGLVLIAIAIPIGVGVFVLLGPVGIIEAMTNWGAWMATLPPEAFMTPPMLFGMGSIGALAILLVAAIGFAFIGPLYGMSKEIVEGGETHAEAAFTWLRKKFFAFATAGVLMFLVVVGPAALVGVVAGYLSGWTLIGLPAAILNAAAFVWFFFTIGLVATTLPGVADGMMPVAALRQSIRNAITHFDRVYGVLAGFVILLAAVFGPVALWGHFALGSMTVPLLDPITIVVAIWTIFGALVMGFIGIPAYFLAFTRVYLILQGKPVAAAPGSEVPDVSLIGGN